MSGDAEGEEFDETETDFGLNGGAGLQFNLTGLTLYAEVRYHTIFAEEDNTNMIPITFGIMFTF